MKEQVTIYLAGVEGPGLGEQLQQLLQQPADVICEHMSIEDMRLARNESDYVVWSYSGDPVETAEMIEDVLQRGTRVLVIGPVHERVRAVIVEHFGTVGTVEKIAEAIDKRDTGNRLNLVNKFKNLIDPATIPKTPSYQNELFAATGLLDMINISKENDELTKLVNNMTSQMTNEQLANDIKMLLIKSRATNEKYPIKLRTVTADELRRLQGGGNGPDEPAFSVHKNSR